MVHRLIYRCLWRHCCSSEYVKNTMIGLMLIKNTNKCKLHGTTRFDWHAPRWFHYISEYRPMHGFLPRTRHGATKALSSLRRLARAFVACIQKYACKWRLVPKFRPLVPLERSACGRLLAVLRICKKYHKALILSYIWRHDRVLLLRLGKHELWFSWNW